MALSLCQTQHLGASLCSSFHFRPVTGAQKQERAGWEAPGSPKEGKRIRGMRQKQQENILLPGIPVVQVEEGPEVLSPIPAAPAPSVGRESATHRSLSVSERFFCCRL